MIANSSEDEEEEAASLRKVVRRAADLDPNYVASVGGLTSTAGSDVRGVFLEPGRQ